MKTLKLILLTLFVATLLAACSNPPSVLQGNVVSYDKESKTLVVKDELPPNSDVSFSLAGTEIGAEPVASDQVRIAYKAASGAGPLQALRVMNLTRQKEIGKGGGGGH